MRTEQHIIKNRYSTHGIHRDIPVYEMNTVHCSASPMEGYKGTEVTLIDNAAWNEKFSAWALTGATATGNNIVLNNDVTAQGIYETAKNVTLQTDGHGAINSTKMSGFIGDQATLSNTPDSTYVFSGYTLTGANLTGNKFNFIGNDVTAKAWFYSVSPTKNARIALRFYDVANSFTSGGKTFYPFSIHQRLVVTSYTGDNIDSLMTPTAAARAIYFAFPLWNNGDTASQEITHSANSINFTKVDNVHLYANMGTTTAGCYEIRGRCNVNNELIALQQYDWSASQWFNHQVNARNIKDSNNLWIYGRGQGIPTDYNVAGSALYATWNNANIPVEVKYWYNSTAICAPNPIVQHSDIIADITWTE